MSLTRVLKAIIPEGTKQAIASLVYGSLDEPAKDVAKYSANMNFWRGKLESEGGRLRNSHYERTMLAMAEESSDDFLAGKVVADFGCGPRGSLVWARSALVRIGIDVQADRFADEFKDNIIAHGMMYLKCTEKVIPLPSSFCDIVFTLNAMDHVNDFPTMCSEILRILKPGGLFVGSFNLEEPPTACEPQTLSEETVRKELLDYLEVQSYRVSKQGPPEDPYGAFFGGTLSHEVGERGYLWVRARKSREG
jgi:SAM-dependent methyltransferase